MIWRDIVILKFKIGVISRKVVNVKNLEDCKTFLFFLFFFFFFCNCFVTSKFVSYSQNSSLSAIQL